MSDKDKNPDFTIDVENELEFDDSIFEDDEELEKKEETNEVFSENKEEKEDFQDLITEEELENLIIGIDEENDILDIPDEEEVLEELKFLDENFSIPDEVKVEPIMEEKEEKKSKKEKAPKKEKKPKEPFDFRFFLLKNKFKLLGVFIVFVVGIFVTTFLLVLDRKPKVEKVKISEEKEAVNIDNENRVINEETGQGDLTEEDKEIETLKEELSKTTEISEKTAIQQKIIDLENQKVMKKREAKILNLKKYFDSSLKNLKISIIKSEDKVLVVAFIAQNNNYEDELLMAITKTFEDDFDIDKASFSILSQGEHFEKIGEVTVDINKFKEVITQNKSVKEKLKLMNFELRK